MSDAPQFTLVGRTSSWRLHLSAPATRKPNQVTRSGAPDAPLLVTWLRHPSYGLIGVYTTNDFDLSSQERQRGSWVRVTGSIRPCRVVALPDDPRSALAPTDAPLLLALASIETIAPSSTVLERPLRATPQSVRISSVQRARSRRIASVVGWPDAVVWQPAQTSSAVFASWNTVYGVVTDFNQQRYLRYVLRHVSPTEESKRAL